MKIRVCGSGFTCAQIAPIEQISGCSNQSWEKVDVRDGAKIWPKRERRTKQSQNLPRGRRPPWGCGSPTWRLSRRSAPPPRGWQTGRLPAAPAMPSHVACVTRGRWDGHQGGGRALKYSGMSPRAPTEGLLLGIITPMISTGPYPPKKNVNLCLSKQELLSNIGSNCLTDAAREPTTGCSVGRGEGGTPSTG